MNKISPKLHLPPAIITLLGIYLRLNHLARVPSDAPFRLGGLFFEFSRQIIANGYALPKTIPFYSAGGIPFAYPPLGFYIQAIIIDLFSPPRFWTVNWLPPLVAALTVPSFYFLLRKLTDDKNLILGALFAYAMMPAAFSNQIEAAGLAEAFGTLSLIWYAYFLICVKESGKAGNLFKAGILLAAAVMSSPGSAVGAVVVSLFFFGQMLLNGSRFLIRLVLVGVIGFIASAPYWLTVVHNHGVAIFASPISGQFNHAQTGSFIASFLQSFFQFNYAGGDYALLWNAFILTGLLWYLFEKNWFLLSLFFALALIPRENVWLTALVTPLFAGAGLTKIALPLLDKGLKSIPPKRTRLTLFTGIALLMLASIFINTSVVTEKMINEENWQISAAQIAELDSLRAEIPPDAKVLIVGNEGLLEWAPQLLQREVINTSYGLEWQPAEFVRVLAINDALKNAEIWDDVLKTVQDYTKINSLYILSDKENVLRLSTQETSLIAISERSLLKLEKLSTQGK